MGIALSSARYFGIVMTEFKRDRGNKTYVP